MTLGSALTPWGLIRGPVVPLGPSPLVIDASAPWKASPYLVLPLLMILERMPNCANENSGRGGFPFGGARLSTHVRATPPRKRAREGRASSLGRAPSCMNMHAMGEPHRIPLPTRRTPAPAAAARRGAPPPPASCPALPDTPSPPPRACPATPPRASLRVTRRPPLTRAAPPGRS